MSIPAISIIALLLPGAYANAAEECGTATGVSLQILGSGGPVADDARSSASYLVWIDGQSKILVDTGGGAFLRFGEAGARFDELDYIALSHFHTDHSADLVTFLKTGVFSDRQRDLGLSGPDAGGPFPGLDKFLDRTIGKDGAYGYLAGYLDGSGGLVQLQPRTLAAASRQPMPVLGDQDSAIQIEALGVPHGIVPALAYRVRTGDKVIVFSGDQNGDDEEFIAFAHDADLLVMHMPVPEGVSGAGRKLHAPPGRIGQIASDADVKMLVLSHFMARSLRGIDANIDLVRHQYKGNVVKAEDLMCIVIAD
jgi:ribonuclease BN (tRNA processing enzyme)